MFKKILVGLIFLLALVGVYSLTAQKSGGGVLGGFQDGIVNTVATSSELTVGTTAITVLATSTCASRSISTTGKAIMVTFSDYANHTPTASFGYLQGASTSVMYDANSYGCGRWKVYGFDAGSSITVTEYR